MQGIILIDKPAGWTSFDVVNYVRSKVQAIIRQEHELRGFCMEMQRTEDVSSGPSRTKSTVKGATEQSDKAMRFKTSSASSSAGGQGWRCKCRVKVGHTGTLDPAATGLLVVCVGKKFTQQVPQLIKQDKIYEVELTLGKTSTTGDKVGDITAVSDEKPTKKQLEDAVNSFVGQIKQTPPAYSAVKIDGKRAYELARDGKAVALKPRSVTVHSIKQLTYDYPQVTFTAHVGSGTYIRSLAEDIGKKLQTGAYMSNLRRTAVGDTKITQAYPVSALDEHTLQKALASNR